MKDEFILNFIDGNMWRWLVDGLKNTLIITFFSLIIGVAIGIIVASVRSTFDKNREVYRRRGGFFYYFQWCINALANVYLTVIRGTPVVVQLLISYFIIFSSSRNGIGIAIFAFGLNSGAYVAEIMRGGINAVDIGQTEAGRSLGLSSVTTMKSIVLPQAIKNVLPAIGNEFISLLKETSVIGFLGVIDLTKAAERVISRTMDVYFPYLSIALVYLAVVYGLNYLFKLLERRLAKSDR